MALFGRVFIARGRSLKVPDFPLKFKALKSRGILVSWDAYS